MYSQGQCVSVWGLEMCILAKVTVGLNELVPVKLWNSGIYSMPYRGCSHYLNVWENSEIMIKLVVNQLMEEYLSFFFFLIFIDLAELGLSWDSLVNLAESGS